MISFPTYGMAGIGIAAAIGFVFALSFLGNNGAPNGVDESRKSGVPMEQQRTSAPPADQEATDNTSMFAKDAGVESGAPASETANMMQVDLRPTLTSIVALNANREVIGDVLPGMEFEVGKPVLIQASFANQNNGVVTDHFINISIRSSGGSDTLSQQEGQPFEHAADFKGDIAANSTIELELYWTPQRSGDYTLMLFSVTPGDLASTVPVKPTVGIPINVPG